MNKRTLAFSVSENELWNFRSHVGYFRSRERQFRMWNFRSLELSLHGTFVPWNFRPLELSLPAAKMTWNSPSQHELSVIYTDFKKAFDKVFHNRLISRLGSYGIDQALVSSPYAHGNLFSRLRAHGVKHDPNSSPVFSNNFRATKKLKAHASSTKTQQLRALKFLIYFIQLCK